MDRPPATEATSGSLHLDDDICEAYIQQLNTKHDGASALQGGEATSGAAGPVPLPPLPPVGEVESKARGGGVAGAPDSGAHEQTSNPGPCCSQGMEGLDAVGDEDFAPSCGGISGDIDVRRDDMGAGREVETRGKGGRTRRKRTPQQQLLNKLAQQRYRERRKQKMTEMESSISHLQTNLARLDSVERENSLLRSINGKLQSVVREQQETISVLWSHVLSSEGQPVVRGRLVQQLPGEAAQQHSQLLGQNLPQGPAVQQQWQPTLPGQQLAPEAPSFAGASPAASYVLGSPGGQRPGESPGRSGEVGATILGGQREVPESSDMPPPSPFRVVAHTPFTRETQGSIAQGAVQGSYSSSLTFASPIPGQQTESSGQLSQDIAHQRISSSVPCAQESAVAGSPETGRSHTALLEMEQKLHGFYSEPERRAQSMILEHEQLSGYGLSRLENRSLVGVPGELPRFPTHYGRTGIPTVSEPGAVGASPRFTPRSGSQQGTSTIYPSVQGGSPSPASSGMLSSQPEELSGPTMRSPESASLKHELETQIQALQQVLEANGVFMGGLQVASEVVQLIQKMLTSISGVCTKIVREKAPRASDLLTTGIELLENPPGPQERTKWDQCLMMINLSKSQENAILNLRTDYMSRMRVINDERAVLNNQARALLQASRAQRGVISDDMSAVWAEVKNNINKEHKLMVEAMQCLWFTILQPVQTALLMVEAYPDVADVLKLANTLAHPSSEVGSAAVDTLSTAEFPPM